MEANKAKIRSFFYQFLRNHDLKDDDDVFALGFVNSLFAMQLVMFVESQFDVTIGDEDLELDNFKSINAIADLVFRKTAPASL